MQKPSFFVYPSSRDARLLMTGLTGLSHSSNIEVRMIFNVGESERYHILGVVKVSGFVSTSHVCPFSCFREDQSERRDFMYHVPLSGLSPGERGRVEEVAAGACT